jgi:hypothetical protein
LRLQFVQFFRAILNYLGQQFFQRIVVYSHARLSVKQVNIFGYFWGLFQFAAGPKKSLAIKLAA